MADKGITEDPDTILVKGEIMSVGQQALTLHFTNKKKCGGGEIANMLLKDDQATITFCDPSGMPCKQIMNKITVVNQCMFFITTKFLNDEIKII